MYLDRRACGDLADDPGPYPAGRQAAPRPTRRPRAVAASLVVVVLAGCAAQPSASGGDDAASSVSRASGAAAPPREDASGVSLDVPGDEVLVELTVTPSTVRRGQRPEVRLRNTGEVPVSHGLAITLQRWTGRAWEPFQGDGAVEQGVPAIALSLPAGAVSEPLVTRGSRRVPLPAGAYRVVTKVHVAVSEGPPWRSREVTVEDRFAVVGP